MQYPFKPGRIKLSDAIDFIAKVAYPELDWRAARKRVRERVRYAVDKEQVAKGLTIDAESFFAWAIGKWPPLRRVSGIPLTPVIGKAKLVAASIAKLSAFGVVLPGDLEELKQRYVDCETRCRKLAHENADLKKRVQIMGAELTEWRAQDAERRQTGSEYGREGGRGKKK